MGKIKHITVGTKIANDTKSFVSYFVLLLHYEGLHAQSNKFPMKPFSSLCENSGRCMKKDIKRRLFVH